MKLLAKVAIGIASIGLLAGTAQRVHAAPVTLADLIMNGGTITSGDKVFSNFMYSSTGSMPSASMVNVLAVTDPTTGAFGIEFQAGFNATFTSTPSDALIKFTVTSQGNDITGAILQGNPAVKGSPPNGTMGVTESFLNSGVSQTLTISAINGNTPTDRASATFGTPLHSLNVQKDILGQVGNDATTVDLSQVDQFFPQGGTPHTPEPASLVLLGIGSLGLLGYRRYCR